MSNVWYWVIAPLLISVAIGLIGGAWNGHESGEDDDEKD